MSDAQDLALPGLALNQLLKVLGLTVPAPFLDGFETLFLAVLCVRGVCVGPINLQHLFQYLES